jgi:WD40 repeat protein
MSFVRAVCEVSVGTQKLLAAAGGGGIVRLRNPRTGDLVREIRADEPVWSMCEVPFRHGSLLATGSGDGTARLWNPRTGDLVHAMRVNSRKGRNQVHALCVVSVGGRQVVALGGSNVELRDPESGDLVNTLSSFSGDDITFLCEIEVKGHRMLAGSDDDRRAQLWDPADRRQANPLEVQWGVDLMGTARIGNSTFLACRNFDTVALRDPQEVFKRAL